MGLTVGGVLHRSRAFSLPVARTFILGYAKASRKMQREQMQEQKKVQRKVRKILIKPQTTPREKVGKVRATKGGMKRPRRQPQVAEPQATPPRPVLWSQVLANVAAQYDSASKSRNGKVSQSSSSTSEPHGHPQEVIAVCDSDEDSQFALIGAGQAA